MSIFIKENTKMKNLSLTMLILLLLFIGCSNQKAKEVNAAKDNGDGVLTEKFEDETFSIMLPKGWVSYRADYDPRSEGLEKAIKDHNAEGYTLELWSPDTSLGVLLVKSAYGWFQMPVLINGANSLNNIDSRKKIVFGCRRLPIRFLLMDSLHLPYLLHISKIRIPFYKTCTQLYPNQLNSIMQISNLNIVMKKHTILVWIFSTPYT